MLSKKMLERKSNFDPDRLLSAQKLKADNNFTPCPIDDGDELYPNGIFVFNITKMICFIASNPKEIDCVKIEENS